MTITTREIENLYAKYNPNNIRTGDRVLVRLHSQQYFARIVGLDLDIKNKKVFASLKLLNITATNARQPTRVDVTDCTSTTNGFDSIYPGHNPKERKS